MRRAVFLGLTLVAFLSECSRDSATSPCKYQSCPAISFRTDIIPIFTQYCATTGCHAAIHPQAGVALDSADAYVSATRAGTGYVIAGNANNSILYDQLLPTGSPHMPLVGSPQPSSCQVQEIYCWIQQGALNN